MRGHRASGEERSAHPVVSEVVRLPPERQSKKVKVKTYKFNLRSERGLVSLFLTHESEKDMAQFSSFLLFLSKYDVSSLICSHLILLVCKDVDK